MGIIVHYPYLVNNAQDTILYILEHIFFSSKSFIEGLNYFKFNCLNLYGKFFTRKYHFTILIVITQYDNQKSYFL